MSYKLLVILLSFGVASVGEMQAQRVLTLDSCIRLAQENNAEVKTSKLEIERAQEVKKQAFTKYFPQVQLNGVGYYAVRPMIRFGLEDIQSDDMRQILQDLYNLLKTGSDLKSELELMHYGASYSVQAVEPLYWGGRIRTGNKLAQMGVEAAQLQSEVTQRDVVENIESSYYLVIGLQEKVGTLQAALQLLDSIQHVAQTAYEAGLVTQSDLLAVTLKQNEFKAKELQLKNGIMLSKKLLCAQIGMDYAEGIEFRVESLELRDESLELRDEGTDFSGRPERELLALNVRAQQLMRKMTLGEALPQVALGGVYYGGNILKKNFTQNGIFFLTATIPLSQWWETSHKLKEQSLKIREAEVMQENLNRMMGVQEEKAFTDMQEAEALMKSDSAALDMAQENNRLALLNYENGLTTMTELLQAHTLLLQAENTLTDRQLSYLSARRRYRDLTGK